MAQITLRDYLQETEDAIRDDRIDDAFTHCQNILAQFPESLEAQRLLGEAYLAQGQLEEAQQSFDWILTNDPENVVAYCNRALISERALDYDTALDCYQQAYELSHGNSQIRQEFNRLSTETGPQGFMFSRAGLARLYMRGDLLTQAIQEWEAVLTVAPERLDARVGLLETCWREAYYDRVEQLATQILQDVPGCLKALLLLSYVSSAQNMQRAQELLRRAEALDPDHLMAQELFSDFMARQPAEPFLQLLKKAPAALDTAHPQSPITPSVANLQDALAQSTGVPAPSLPAQALSAWNDTSWASTESDVTLVRANQEMQRAPEPSPMPVWSDEATPALDVWSALEGSPVQNAASVANSLNYNPSVAADRPLETWQPEPSVSTPSIDTHQQEAEVAPWDNSGLYASLQEQNLDGIDPWADHPGSLSESGMWGTSSKESAIPSPPAWLNMLTQSEIQQLNDGDVSEPSPIETLVSSFTPPVQPTEPEKPEVPAGLFFGDDDDEPLSFGPEWLKSIGATSLENGAEEVSPVLSSSPSATPETLQAQPSRVSQQLHEPQPVAFETPVYEPQPMTLDEKVAEPAGVAEFNLLATLEGLEAGLRSQGFVPLQPKSLQAIAKIQETPSSSVPKTPELALPQENEYQEYEYQKSEFQAYEYQKNGYRENEYQNEPEPFPSALTELENFVQEPSWLASLSAISTPSPVPELPQEMVMPQMPQEEQKQQEHVYSYLPPAQPSWPASYEPHVPSLYSSSVEDEEELIQPTVVHPAQSMQPLPNVAAREEELLANPIYGNMQPERVQMNRPQEVFAAQMPAASAHVEVGAQVRQPSASYDFLLNNELETTMKRPAVRLQSMRQEPSFTQDAPSISPLARAPRMAEPERAWKAPEGNISYQDRLLKGYQHQLVGDYDEAMHEYRLIIRNSPELLSEVVSNMRALLKLAPKYSTGYRVLGDAYMRQGEYLQAMEAYNKALTMAKKAKS